MNHRPRALLIGVCLLFPVAAKAQVPPEKAEATFQVVDGLEMKLWASEPLFANPTSMDVDHKGRVWVCESINYRCRLHNIPLRRPEGDRILILEDSKGTGHADKVTVFYQSPEILAPLGIAVAKDPVGPGYKVFVCQSPDILLFEDKDGDGKADGPPKKLLTGFRGIDHDHGVHGILIGPDMKLYFSVGDQGVQNLQSSDGKGRKWTSNSTDCRAGTIWRCDLDGKNLELIAHNFRNEYEPCVDSFGTVFVSDNDDDGNQQTRICYVMPGGNYGYHPRGPGETHWHEEQPGVVPKILRTYFGSPTGMCVYEGTLLPKKYWGQPLHTDAGPRHVRCYHLTPEGASYAVEREDMVTSTDNWFRPSDICVAPDGSVFVADWYDPGVGGHGIGDFTRGRIYRIAPKGNRPSVPKVDLESKEGLVAALSSPCLAVRYMAMAQLNGMKLGDARAALSPAMAQKENPWVRARALWLLALAVKREHEGKFEDAQGLPFLLRLAFPEDTLKDPQFTVLWLRICKEFFSFSPAELTASNFQKYVEDCASAAVSREALLLMRDANPNQAKFAIYELAKKYDGKDRFYLAAIGIAVGHDPARRAILLADFLTQFPEWTEQTAGLIWELRPEQVMPLLETRLADAKLSAAQRAQVVDILAASNDPAAGKSLLKVLRTELPLEVRERAQANFKLFLPSKWASLRNSTELSETIADLLRRPETILTALGLIASAERIDLIGQVATLAGNAREPGEVRSAAVKTLAVLRSPEAVAALERVLKDGPTSLRIEAAQALAGQLQRGRRDNSAAQPALKVLQGVATTDGTEPEVRLAVVAALATNPAGSQWLLDLQARKVLPEAVRAEAGRLLRNSPFENIRRAAMTAFPAPGKLDPKKVPSLQTLAARRGDAQRGKQLFAASLKNESQCLKCHTIHGVGGKVGPDLSVIGKKASRENLFESLLYPSKAIADQFVSWNIVTQNGLSITGLLIEETPAQVVLRDANATDHPISKKDILERSKSLISLMPDNLIAAMTEDDLVDMVEYLFGLKTPALAFDSWHIAGPFDNGENDAGLERVFPPEKNVDLKASYTGKVGPVSWRKVKPVRQGYVDLQEFLAPNSNNVVSYLYREVESPIEQEADVLLGTDDGAKLWINGTMVYTSTRHRPAVPEEDRVKVRLRKGVNTILLKINNGDGMHGFYLTVLSEQELKLGR